MGRNGIVPAVAVLLLASSYAGAADCGLTNASFEDDGGINNIAVTGPSGWDVNVPAPQFRGYVSSGWRTEGSYSVTMYSEWFVPLAAGDTATVSQELILDGISEIIFDLKLDTLGFTRWDPNVCTAVALVDNDVAWESAFPKRDIRGEYLGQAFAVDAKYRDGQRHRLSLGLRIHTAGALYERYVSTWDSIECVPLGLGGDFNSDGRVDLDDLMTMAGMWAHKVPADSPYNLCGFDDDEVELTGRVNFYDLAVLAKSWRCGPLEQQ